MICQSGQELENELIKPSMGETITQLEDEDVALIAGSSMTEGHAATENLTHTLESLLERATLVDSFVLGGGTATVPQRYPWSANHIYLGYAPGITKAYDMPSALFEKNIVVAEKLKNFRWIRGDLEFELKYNAQPFISGGLQMSWFPMASTTDPMSSFQNTTLQGLSSQPNVQQFLTEGQSMKFTVPWMHIRDYLATGDDRWSDPQGGSIKNSYIDAHSKDFGKLAISVTHAIQEGVAAASVTADLFARWVNVSIALPTNGDQALYHGQAVSQEFQRIANLSNEDKIALYAKLTESEGFVAQSGIPDTFVAQASVPTKKNSERKQRVQTVPETERPGIVERIAGTVAGVADAVIPFAPMLQPVGWMARATQKVASAMGWSVPTTTEGIARVSRVPGFGMMHTEGKDTSTNLGIIPDGGIKPDGAILEPDIDELSLDYILNRWERNGLDFKPADTGSGWLTSMTPNSQIGIIDAYPRFVPNDYGRYREAKTQVQAGCFNYTVGMFQKWRGSIEYEIELSKTNFHQGRFIAVLCPNGEVPDELGDLMSTNICWTYDLNDTKDNTGGCRFKFTVPYLNNAPWANRYRGAYAVQTENYVAESQNFQPRIGIYVLTRLQCPDSCSNSVPITYRMRAGPDFAVAEPRINYASCVVSVDNAPISATNSQTIIECDSGTTEVTLWGAAQTQTMAQLSKWLQDGDIEVTDWPTYTDLPWAESMIGKTYSKDGLEYEIRGGLTHLVYVQQKMEIKYLKSIQLVFGIVSYWDNLVTSTLADFVKRLNANTISVTGEFDTETFLNAHYAMNEGEGLSDLIAQSGEPESDLIAQSGETTKVVSNNGIVPFVEMDEIQAEATCIGESIKSLRPLIKRFAPTTTVGSTWTNEINANSVEPLTWRDMVGRMYRFYYGGTRVKIPLKASEHCTGYIVPNQPLKTLRGFIKSKNDAGTLDPIQGIANDTVKFEGGCEYSGVVTNMAEFQLPYYNTARLRLINPEYQNTSIEFSSGASNWQNRWPWYDKDLRGKGYDGPMGVAMVYDFDKTTSMTFTANTRNKGKYGSAPGLPYYFTQEQADAAGKLGVYVNGRKLANNKSATAWSWFSSCTQPSPLINEYGTQGTGSSYTYEVAPSFTNQRTLYMASDDTGGFTYLVAPTMFDQFFSNQGQGYFNREYTNDT